MSRMKTTSTRWSIRRMLITLASTTVVWCAAAAALAGADVNTDATGVVLHGYDPVAYFTEGKPVAGDEHFSADFGGGKYLFSTDANGDAFVANPAKFAPQYGGYCAFGVAMGHKFDVDPGSFKIVDGKLYLNLNPQVLKKWSADITGFIQKSEANWPKIRDKEKN
jgi:YHS domain-containing protein